MTEESSAGSLQSRMGPIVKFVNELDEIRLRRRIADSNTLSWVGLLTMELRDDILKTLHSMLYEVEDKITACNTRIDETNAETKAELSQHKAQMGTIEEDVRLNATGIAKLKSSNSEHADALDAIREELNDKASVYKVEEIMRQLKSFVTRGEFQELAIEVSNCTRKEEFEAASEKIEQLLATSVTKTEFKEKMKKNHQKTIEFIKKGFAQRRELEQLTEQMNQYVDELRGADKTTNSRLTLKEQALKKDINTVASQLASEPWMPKVNDIEDTLLEKSDKAEFFDLKRHIDQTIQRYQAKVKKLKDKTIEFGRVVERFDEVLLDKASKDDLKAVNVQLPFFLLSEEFSHYQEDQRQAALKVDQTLDLLRGKSTDLASNMQHIITRFEGLRRENYEISTISRSFQQFREELALKAEKMDVFAIHDVMGKREEIVRARDEVDVLRQQLEMHTVLALELSRTLLKNGEPQNVVLKQRFEVFKNLSSLLNWLHGKHTRPQTQLPELDYDLIPEKSLTSRHTSRNFAYTSRIDHRTVVEFPPIKS